MLNFLKQWLRAQASFFFWSYVPVLAVIIFGLFAVTYFPSIAIEATGIFILFTFAFIAFIFWIKRPR